MLNPGTSAGGTFFGPFANALTKKLKGWQVWAIERRENLLEDHSYLEKYVNGEISNQEIFDYYLGWITDPSISPHFTPKTTAETEFAKQLGDERRSPRHAEGRQGREEGRTHRRHGRSLARRFHHHRLRDLGLQWQGRGEGSLGTRLHRWRGSQQPDHEATSHR